MTVGPSALPLGVSSYSTRTGESLWSQRGRDVHVRPGDFVVCSTAEPYALRFRGPYDMPVLVIPQSTMRQLTPDPDQFLGSGTFRFAGVLSKKPMM